MGPLFRVLLVSAPLLAVVGCGAARPASPPRAVSSQPAPPEHGPESELVLFGDAVGATDLTDLDGGQAAFNNRLVANVTQHSFTSEGRDFDPDVDLRGELLAFASTRHAEHPDIYLKGVDSTGLTQLTSDPADDVQPRFSPDGQRIAFASNRSGTWDLWLINRDGTGLTQLTHDLSDEIAPCWSPDGSQIAFTVWSPRGHVWEIWALTVDRPGVRKFLVAGMFPAWSPDGARLAFQRARQRGSRWFSIWTVDLVDGEARNPTEVAQADRAACIAPQWGPEGRWLVYCALTRPAGLQRAAGDADLWAVSVESGARRKLTDGSAAAFNPAWSRAGRVYFVSNRTGTENIWSVPAEVGPRPPADAQARAGSTVEQ